MQASNTPQTTSNIKELILRYTSRKFLIVIAGIVLIAAAGLTDDQIKAVLALIVPYLAAEGAADTAERWAAPKAEAAKASLQETQISLLGDVPGSNAVDRSTLVAGSDIPMQ